MHSRTKCCCHKSRSLQHTDFPRCSFNLLPSKFILQVQLHLNSLRRLRKKRQPSLSPVCLDTRGRNNNTTQHTRRGSNGRQLDSCWCPGVGFGFFFQREFQSSAGTSRRDVRRQPSRDHGSQNNNKKEEKTETAVCYLLFPR